uniref:Secreted protein n=1 Tax=Caenorhabditis tropicalis TaxID=1561998 RepID=A0A1I7UPV8_9PELO
MWIKLFSFVFVVVTAFSAKDALILSIWTSGETSFWITLKSIVKYAGIVMGTIKVIQVTLQEDVNKA